MEIEVERLGASVDSLNLSCDSRLGLCDRNRRHRNCGEESRDYDFHSQFSVEVSPGEGMS